MISELHKCWIEVTLKYLGDCGDVDGVGGMVIKDFEIKKNLIFICCFQEENFHVG